MTARRRVALFSSEYPPNVLGGLGIHVERLTAALADAVSFDVFLPERGDYVTADPGVRIHEVPAVPAVRTDAEHWLCHCQAAARMAEPAARAADLLHCHDWMTALAGLRLRETAGRPLVFNVHLPQGKGLRLALENLGLLAADLVLVNSRAIEREIRARSLPLRRVEVVPNGVDLDAFRPADDWPRDGGYVLFVGRLVAQKGVDLLLHAFHAVVRRCPAARLVVVGDGELELYLQRVARHLGLSARVEFAGWRTGPALVELYRGAQAVVVPSLYEPFGIVALEAMACARPVVASRTGGLEEIIDDGVEGYLVEVGDRMRLAGRLARLLRDEGLRARMGEAARARACRFGWDRVAARTLALYDEMAGRPAGPLPEAVAGGLREELLAGVDATLRPVVEEVLEPARAKLVGASGRGGRR